MLAAAWLFGLVSTLSGWFVTKGSRATLSGVVLVAGGVTVLGGCAAMSLGLQASAEVLFAVAGFVVVPLAVTLYPRPSWVDPLFFVAFVVVATAGVMAVGWSDARSVLGFVLAGALLVRYWWAFERATPADRRALAWCALAWVSAGVIGMAVGFIAEADRGAAAFDPTPVALVLAIAGPVAMAVGVVRPELVDVRGLVTRTVVAAAVLVAFVATASGLNALTQMVRGEELELESMIVLCAVLAFGVWPLQVCLRGVVDHLLFGRRPDPLDAATRVVGRVGGDPETALRAVREALVLPYASLRAPGFDPVSSGVEVTHTRTFALRLGDDVVGEMIVGLRPGDLSLPVGDEQVLRIVAPLLAQTIRAQNLAREARASRHGVVLAIEEERLRLRRDLHDGLGPTLTGITFTADAARNQLSTDPVAAEALIARLRRDAAEAIVEVRRLVEGLRPPALDELGLVGALREYATGVRTSTGQPLAVTIELSEAIPVLPAAIEVAAYRIVVEALTNVSRHADRPSCVRVLLAAEGAGLRLIVADDGRPARSWPAGIGMTSMRERAEQVGGRLSAGPTDEGGLVEGRVPLHIDRTGTS